ncbi:MAG: baseplate J/gp47 family protein, partial [Beijerinckiaceae bacterium]
SAGNGLGTTAGRITTSIPGISQDVQVCGGYFCGGSDAETCEEFRQRYIRRKAYQPRATLAWLKEKALEWPCVTRVCVRNCSCCEAVFDVQLYAMFDDTFPNGIAPVEAIQELSEWMFGTPQGLGLGEVEIGVFGGFYAVTPAKFNIVIDGLQCLTGEQIEQIKVAVTDAMKTLCPSERLCARTIDLIIAQIAGVSCDFCVQLDILDPDKLADDNGDLVPDCDVLPVMNDVIVLADQCVGTETCG